MLIKVEPAGFFMYTVQMIFDLEHPDSEDQPVRDYLDEHQLEPRRQSEGEYEGRQCQVMQFGGCYLGRHLNEVGQIQRRAVEVELITAEVETHLASLSQGDLSWTEDQRQEAVAVLVGEFNQESAFRANEQGELTAALDGEAVREAALRLLAEG